MARAAVALGSQRHKELACSVRAQVGRTSYNEQEQLVNPDSLELKEATMSFLRSAVDAELAAARHMRKLGFWDAAVTAAGADAGIDVSSEYALAQVKWKNAMVGRPEVQRLFGARAMDLKKQLVFYSTSGYSKHALEYADDNQIALFTLEPIGDPKAVNKTAAELVARRDRLDEEATKVYRREHPRPESDAPYQPRTAVSEEWREEWKKQNSERLKRQAEARRRTAEISSAQREAERRESKRRRDILKGVPYSGSEKFRVVLSVTLALLFLLTNIYWGAKLAPAGEVTLFRVFTGVASFVLLANAFWRRPAKDDDPRIKRSE